MTVGAAVLLSQTRKVWVVHPGIVGNLIVDCELLLYANSCCAFMSEDMRRHIDGSRHQVTTRYGRHVPSFLLTHVTEETQVVHLHAKTGCRMCLSSSGNKQHLMTATLTDSLLFNSAFCQHVHCAVGGLWDCAKDVNHLTICYLKLKIIWIAKFLNQIWNWIQVFQFFFKLNCLTWFNRTSN